MIVKIHDNIFAVDISDACILFSKYTMQPVIINTSVENARTLIASEKSYSLEKYDLNLVKEDVAYSQTDKFSYIGFNPTDSCNLNCKYCLKNKTETSSSFSVDKIRKSIRELLRLFSLCADSVKIEISGGEPFGGIKEIRAFSEILSSELFSKYGKNISIKYRLITNGTIINDDIISFLKKENIELGVSIDCSQLAHDLNRIQFTNIPTYKKILENLQTLKDAGVTMHSIMITVTENNIDLFRIDELKTLIKSFNIRSACFQLDKDWNRVGNDVLLKFKNFITQCYNYRIPCYFEAYDVIHNFLNYRDGAYNLFSSDCGYYDKIFFYNQF